MLLAAHPESARVPVNDAPGGNDGKALVALEMLKD